MDCPIFITQNFESEFKSIVGAIDKVKSKASLSSGMNNENEGEPLEFNPELL
jgi:hypothetical protein